VEPVALQVRRTHRCHVFDQLDDDLGYLRRSGAFHPPVALPPADVADRDKKRADKYKTSLKKKSLCHFTTFRLGSRPKVKSPGVEDHGQRDGGDSFDRGHAGDGGAFGLQLDGEGFGDAAQEHVEDAQLVPVALLRGVDDVADVRRRQRLHADDAGESHRRDLREDAPEQRRDLR